MPAATTSPSRAEAVYERIRRAILSGRFAPEQALRPQELATECGVSLAVAREALLRIVGEGLAERLPNRGFQVPRVDGAQWQQLAEARATVEPAMLRMAVERGDLGWEADVRAAAHVLARTPINDAPLGAGPSDAWSRAHHDFHRALLEGCGNSVLLPLFERLWTASELARAWSVVIAPERDIAGEHQALEQAALSRDADLAARLLEAHLRRTASALRPRSPAAVIDDTRL